MKTSLDNLLDRYNSNRELLYVGLVVLWSACLLYFNPRLLALLSTATDVFSAGAVIIFTLCLDFFWLYMLYHVLMITVSCWVRWKHPSQNLVPVETIVPVAILYPTRNDFRPVSAMSCLNLDYPDFHVFILDDSTDKEFRKNIDEWARTHTDKVTVIRREDKSGYKAGNLNHALETIGKDYPYFAICDADGILPRDFLTGLLPFLQDKRVAYVQALQKGNPDQPEFFGQVLNFMIEAHYRYYVEAKNYFGFVMFYGHGGLLKTSVWQEAGGFPEIASEDLAYSARARALGYRGVYTDTVICLEDFPPGLPQLRKRSEKWIRGTSEFVKKFFWPFVKTRSIPWYEKMDVLVSAFSHYQPLVMLVFLLMLGTLLPVYFEHFRYPGSFLLMPIPSGKSVWEYLVHIRYHIFWSIDFYLVMVLTIICPLVPAMIDLFRYPARLFRFIFLSNFVFLTSLVVETWDVIIFWVTGKAVFRNTLETTSTNQQQMAERFFHPNHRIVFFTEWLVGLILFILGMQTKNLWFMAPAVALLIGPIVCKIGWGHFILRWLTIIPMMVTITILVLVTLDLGMMIFD